jgi:hypothetical protein
VISCEPEFHEHLRANLAAYGDRVTIVPKAIGGPDSRSCIHPFSDGCFASTSTQEHFGELIRLGDILQSVGSEIRLLKLDCEGPEFSIVDDTDLSQIQAIVGEVHPLRYARKEYTFNRFRAVLEDRGFAITKAIRPGETWLFWATR